MKRLRHLPVQTIYGKKNLSLVLVDDRKIAELSKQHGREFHATDILTFSFPEAHTPLAGEIVISLDTAQRQAKARGVALLDELLLLVIHGVLHLQGFDDEAQSDWKKMKAAEYKYFLHVQQKMKLQRGK